MLWLPRRGVDILSPSEWSASSRAGRDGSRLRARGVRALGQSVDEAGRLCLSGVLTVSSGVQDVHLRLMVVSRTGGERHPGKGGTRPSPPQS